MSLTSQLKDASSPVSRFFASRLKSEAGLNQIIDYHNGLLSAQEPFVIEGSDPMETGAAFGYALRWWIAPSKMNQTVAAMGARRLKETELFEAMLAYGTKLPDTIPLFAVMMARFDKAARERSTSEFFQRYASRFKKLLLSWGEPIDASGQIIPYMFDDDAQLRRNIFDVASLYKEIPLAWGDRALMSGKEQIVFSPTFSLSEDVGGADGWMIIDGCLWDCRTTRKWRPFDKSNLLQQLGYVLLDSEDEYKLDTIAWYYARQRVQLIMPIAKLVTDLPKLRQEFRRWIEDERGDEEDFGDEFNYYGDSSYGSWF